MTALKTILKHPSFVWALLCLPILPMLLIAGSAPSDRLWHILVHPTGEWSARLLIFGLMITPLTIVFKGYRWPRWLMKQRRFIGVAAFGYALLHAVVYLIDKGTLPTAIADLTRSYIWLGWLAFIVFVPLAITSTDGWVKRLGTNWKPLQRGVYAAAVLTLLHWAALHGWTGWGAALANFGPLIALETYRVWWLLTRNSRRTAKPASAHLVV